jgi:glycosyltransferase involved in cell wall biosynthesis
VLRIRRSLFATAAGGGVSKVLFVINSLTGGGAERVLTTILARSEARRDRHEMSLALLDDEPDAYPPPDWLDVRRLGGGGGLVESVRNLGSLQAELRPDVTVSFLTRSNVANAIANIASSRPVVISERVHTAAHLGAGLSALAAKSMVRLCYRRSNRVIVVSKGVGDHLVGDFGLPADKVSVIYNPVDIGRIAGLAGQAAEAAPGRPFIFAMGRLVPNKNFELLIRAYAGLQTDALLVIAGEGPHRPMLEGLAAELGLQGKVVFPGFVANPYALMREALFYVLPSNAEGFPNGLVEAMAVGLPVISTDCPSGPAEILEGMAARGQAVDARWGVLTAPDDVPGMRSALESFADPGRRSRFSRLARQRVRRFDVEQAVDAYWSVIEGALGATEPTDALGPDDMRNHSTREVPACTPRP